MTEEEGLAYAAALVDGEGHVRIHNGSPEIDIKMTDIEPVAFVQAVAGVGKLRTVWCKDHQYYMWRWSVSGIEASRFAARIAPYALGKAAQLNMLAACQWAGKDIKRRFSIAVRGLNNERSETA